MANRLSGRIKDANKQRVLDEATRQRRARKALESLESDNFHDDPHADLGNSIKYFKIQENKFFAWRVVCRVFCDLSSLFESWV
jgi:hypothetical protein